MTSSIPARSRSLTLLSDVQWMQSLSATIRAPSAWHEALRKGDVRSASKQLRQRFASFRKFELISALRWSAVLATDALTIEVIDELCQLSSRSGKQLKELLSGTIEGWLDRQPRSDIPHLLDQLLACAVLVQLAPRLSDGVLVRLWRFVEEYCGKVTSSPSTQHPAIRELLTTEMQMLRLVATSVLPLGKADVQPMVATLHEFLGTFTDTDGCPLSATHTSLAAALACVARLVDLFDRLDLNLLDKADRQRLQSFAARAVLLFPIDCSWVPSRTPHEAIDWLQRIVRSCDLTDSEASQRQLKLWKKVGLESAPLTLPTRPKNRSRPLLKKKQLVSHQSDAAQYACLHGDWRAARDRCVVRYADEIPTVELSVLERTLISGDWAVSVTIAGQTWDSGKWNCCCWYSDPEADFCELKWEPVKGITVYRQLLWSRVNRFLVVADELRAPGQCGLSIESQLPLAAGWKALADGRTREWQLHQSQAVARLFPIFSAQERVQNTDGILRCDSQSITTVSSAESDGVYSAMVIDWDSERSAAPAQWGPLSVAEESQRVPKHLACAARWRVGEQLWMVFHQAEKGDSARSALGLHSHHETVIAQVADGKYKSLVEVE